MLYVMAVDGEPCLHEHIDKSLVMVTPDRWRELLSEGDLDDCAAVPIRVADIVEVQQPDFNPMIELRELIRRLHSEYGDQEQGGYEIAGKMMCHAEDVERRMAASC